MRIRPQLGKREEKETRHGSQDGVVGGHSEGLRGPFKHVCAYKLAQMASDRCNAWLAPYKMGLP